MIPNAKKVKDSTTDLKFVPITSINKPNFLYTVQYGPDGTVKGKLKLIKQGFNGINHVDPLTCLIRLKPSFIICSSRENLESIK